MPKSLPTFGLMLACGVLASSAQALDCIEVSFNDPTAQYSAYYADIQRVTSAAGNNWVQHFLDPGASLGLSVQISFASISTASGRSLAAAYLGTSATTGLRLFEQGAAHEINTGFDTNGAAADIEFTLGIDGYLQHELWFDPSPGLRTALVPANQTDAYSVLQHEFGHALGFNGWRDGATGLLPGDYWSTFDALVTPQATASGETQFFFTGAQSVAAYGAALPLTLANYGHLGNWGPAGGTELLPDLMNGLALSRGARYEISALDLQVLGDIGLRTVSAVPEPGTWALWGAGLFALALRRRGGLSVLHSRPSHCLPPRSRSSPLSLSLPLPGSFSS